MAMAGRVATVSSAGEKRLGLWSSDGNQKTTPNLVQFCKLVSRESGEVEQRPICSYVGIAEPKNSNN